MLLTRAILGKVRAGEVSVAYRRWTNPTVKAGGFRVTSIGRLAIDDVRQVTEAEITGGAGSGRGLADESGHRPRAAPNPGAVNIGDYR